MCPRLTSDRRKGSSTFTTTRDTSFRNFSFIFLATSELVSAAAVVVVDGAEDAAAAADEDTEVDVACVEAAADEDIRSAEATEAEAAEAAVAAAACC